MDDVTCDRTTGTYMLCGTSHYARAKYANTFCLMHSDTPAPYQPISLFENYPIDPRKYI